jgi:DNA (cytosine-5)-methyltransferase 3A
VFEADFKQYEGFDYLIGGSPCTYWSIAQTKNRETVASGMGWELFSQYVRALKESKPRYFIYENNNSMSKEIRKSINEAFGFEPILINSSLVSAQNRQRLYWVGQRNKDGTYSKVHIKQPKDRGIFLRDVLDANITRNDKSQIVDSNYSSEILAFSMVGDLDNRKVGLKEKSYCLAANPSSDMAARCIEPISTLDDKKANSMVYEVKDGLITIRNKQYNIKLKDGYYIIRRLTIAECKRLQTVPEWYEFPVSNSQARKMLGNGWTIDVIAHILSFIK